MEILIQVIISLLEPFEKILTWSLVIAIIFGGYILTDSNYLDLQTKIKNKFNKEIKKFIIVFIYGIIISLIYIYNEETTPIKAFVSYVTACTIYSHVVKYLTSKLNKKENNINE